MHGTRVHTDEGWIDTEHPDDVMCRAKLCNHDQVGIDHFAGRRVSGVELGDSKLLTRQRRINHVVYMDGGAKPYVVRQIPGTKKLSCCTKDGWRTEPGARRKVRGNRPQRTNLEGCCHMVAVQDALGWLKVRHRPELKAYDKPVANLLPAPKDIRDPSTLDGDEPRARRFVPPHDLDQTPPSNRMIFSMGADGAVKYDGPDNETSRMLARHAQWAPALARGDKRLMSPVEAFPVRDIAYRIMEAGKDGVTEPDIVQARRSELGADVLLDEPESLSYLATVRPQVEELIHKLGRTLAVNQQRIREGGQVNVLVCL